MCTKQIARNSETNKYMTIRKLKLTELFWEKLFFTVYEKHMNESKAATSVGTVRIFYLAPPLSENYIKQNIC